MKTINKWMSKNKITHLLLDGGTISASDGFLEAYVSDILHGERLCVVEQKTPMFRFFVDVDFVSRDNELDFVKVASELYNIVDLGPCVLARARPRSIKDKGIKYGLHIIWPESRVSKKSANTIRIKILDEFGSDWEGILDPNRVFDPSVYAGSGLRMIWSYKAQDDESTPYIPWGLVDSSGFHEFNNKQPSIEYLKMFSIRIENSKEEVTQEIIETPNELEMFIRRNLEGQENSRIVKINKCKNKKDYWVATDSKYCSNVKRCHKGNHVWFCITPFGVLSQRCLDDECKGFVGKKYKIPSRLIPNERSLAGSNIHCIADYLPDGFFKHKT